MPLAESVDSPFRDATAGALHRRELLLRERRSDLALMPGVLRDLYVHRFAVLCFSLACIVGGGLTVSAAGNGGAIWTGLMPGAQPAVVSNLLLMTWVLAGLAYLLGRSIAEHRFSAAMVRCVREGQDLHQDVERLLRETPETVGREMSIRLEPFYTSAPILALGLLAPLTIAYLAQALSTWGYPNPTLFDEHMSAHTDVLVFFGFFAFLFAAAVMRSASRSKARLRWYILPVFCAVLLPFSHGASTWFLIAVVVLNLCVARSMRRVRFQKEELSQGDALSPVPSLLRVNRRSQVFWLVVSAVVILFSYGHEPETEIETMAYEAHAPTAGSVSTRVQISAPAMQVDPLGGDVDLAVEDDHWFLDGAFTDDPNDDPQRFSSGNLEGYLRGRTPWLSDTEFCLWASAPGATDASYKLYLP